MPSVAELAVTITADTRGFDAGVKHVETETKGLGSSLSSGVGMGLGFGAVSTAIGLLGDAFGAAKGSIIDLNSSLEQSKIAFTTMLGSAEQADAFLQQLQQFAANTPFEFPDLVSASKRMLAFGFESKQVVPLLTAVGDAVAAVGGGAETIDGVTTALGQMQAKGKVSAEEMGQLAERGIPAWDMLAKKLGVDIPTAMDMVSKGAVKSSTFIEAFQEGVSSRFGGMMEKQSLTFAGSMSTITDSLSMATAKAFKPFFDLISTGAVAMSKFVQSDTFNRWADATASAIGDVVTAFSSLTTTVLPVVMDAWNTVRQVFDQDWSPDASINPIVNALGMLTTFIRDDVMPVVSTITGFIVKEFGVVVDWFNTNMPLIQKAVEVVLAQLQKIWDAHGKEVVGILQAAWTIFSTLFDLGLKNLLGLVTIALQILTGDWSGAWSTLETMVRNAWEAYGKIIQAAWDAIFVILDTESGGALTKMATWLDAVNTAVGTGWATVTTTTQTAWTGAIGIVAAVASGWDAITLGTGNAFTLPGGIVALTASGWESATRATATALTEGASSLVGVVTKAWDDVTALIRALGQAGSALISAARDIGTAIVAGLKAGIEGALGDLKSWVTDNLTNALPEWVRTALKISSPSQVFADIGASLVAGLIAGLDRGSGELLKKATELASKLVGSFDDMGDLGGLDNLLKAALEYTGHSESWIPGLKWIIGHESSGNPKAQNPTSSAAGLFQLLDTTWAAYRDKSLSSDVLNPFANAVAGIRYIDQRYDDPSSAIAFWKEHNWYGDGGIAWWPQLAVVGEKGPEAIIPLSRLGRSDAFGSPIETHRFVIQDPTNRTLEEWYVTGRDLAIRRGRAPAGAA